MPDDSPKDFRAAQGKHADDIKTARTLTRLTGLTINQVRQSLRAQAAVASTQQQVAPPISLQGDQIVGKDIGYPTRPTTSSKFDPLPFTLDTKATPKDDPIPGGGESLSDLQTIDAVFAGVRGTIQLNGNAFVPT